MRLVSVLGSVVITGFMIAAATSCSDEGGDGDGDTGGAATGGNGGALTGTGGDGGAGTTGTGGSGNEPPACETLPADWSECGSTNKSADYRTPNILLVVDKSGSMSDTPAGYDVNKWTALQTALQTALSDVASDMNFGLVLYPYNADDPGSTDVACTVPEPAAAVNVEVQSATTAVNEIVGALQGTAPGGGTPTAAALNAAYEYYVNGAGRDLGGEKFVLLATDGGPNCNSILTCEPATCTVNLDGKCTGDLNCCETSTGVPIGDGCLDDVNVLQEIEALRVAGIPTFVVGIPGTEQYSSYLDAFAEAGGRATGGTPQYYAVSAAAGVEGLTQTFRDISTQLVRDCVIPLDEPVLDPNQVNVAIDCNAVDKGDATAGWELSLDPAPGTITLLGSTCEFVQTQGASRVDIVMGCPTIR